MTVDPPPTWLILLMVGAVAGLGCGKVTTSSGPSGVPPDKTLVSLAPQEIASVCDWVNAKYGGYGGALACDGGTRRADRSREACTTGFSTVAGRCPAVTVRTLQDCYDNTADLCAPSSSNAACAALDACGGQSSSTDGGPG